MGSEEKWHASYDFRSILIAAQPSRNTVVLTIAEAEMEIEGMYKEDELVRPKRRASDVFVE